MGISSRSRVVLCSEKAYEEVSDGVGDGVIKALPRESFLMEGNHRRVALNTLIQKGTFEKADLVSR